MKNSLIFFLFVLSQIALVCGCTKSVALLDGKERSDSLVKEATARKNIGNIKSALQLYGEALDRNPKLAIAHLDIALIFHDYEKDYLRAIYHYERYLELRPAAEKRRMIEDRIRLAGHAYAANVAAEGSTVAELGRMSVAVIDLKKENDSLKNSIRQLNLQLEKTRGGLIDMDFQPRSTKLAVPIQDDLPANMSEASGRGGRMRAVDARQEAVRVYRVKHGDTLTSIAAEYYRNAEKADDIFKANRDKLETPGALKVGQVLVLP